MKIYKLMKFFYTLNMKGPIQKYFNIITDGVKKLQFKFKYLKNK